MKYLVSWTPRAEERLANAWLAAPDQKAVTVAAHVLDHHLAIDPLRFGESRMSSINRVAWEAPLGIEFDVIEDDKKVLVLTVWLIS
jgi:hypothetical protein